MTRVTTKVVEKQRKIYLIIFMLIIVTGILWAIIASFSSIENTTQSTDANQISQEGNQEQSKPKTPKEIMNEKISKLINSKEAFDAGSYVKGDIPVGEYVFMPFDGGGKYYSEEDSAGNIIDNENFDSFGYVYVQGVGNLETRGVLVKITAIEALGVKSAKEVYEQLNDLPDYKDSAIYKVGVDIAPGTYTIESFGQGYVEVASGPVGNSDIIDNKNFNGKYSVNVSTGQYLKISRGKIL